MKRAPSMRAAESNTVDEDEVAKFAAIADEWWDSEGPFRPLHQLNPVRLRCICDRAAQHFERDPLQPRPLEGLRILDIGCVDSGYLRTEPC